jgi:tRNA(fMet)-specific endonuclease VapC
MYLLDTNHCSFIIEGDSNVVQKLLEVKEQNIFTCDIVEGELLFMAYNSRYKRENLKKVEDFLSDLGIYYSDEETTKTYAQLKAKIYDHFAPKEHERRISMKLGKIGFSDNDLWIAAHTIRNNLTLVSQDSDFKRMCESPSIEFPLECWKENP